MAPPNFDPASFARARLLVVGDVMLDRFVYGGVARISPEAPIPVMQVERQSAMPGGAGNVARNAASLGASVTLVGIVGADGAAAELAQSLTADRRITAHLIVDRARPTTQKTRFIGGRQQLLRVDQEVAGQASVGALAKLTDATVKAVAACDAIVVSDYAKGVVSDALLAALMKAAKRAGKKVLVDPKGRDFARYRGAAVLTPNQGEAAIATGMACETDRDAARAGQALAKTCKVGAVLITRGANGMTLVGGQKAALHLRSEAREVFDASGAGDTAMAALAVGLAGGLALGDAARIANAAAGIVVGKIGTAIVSPQELKAALERGEGRGIEAKIMALADAQDAVARWRRKGDKIGFTNGVFDLLHEGHLALLNDARGRCDRLIVAINSDASVKKLKGPSRPIQSQATRARVLAALSMVDLVMIFGESTPEPMLRALKPDLLIKGGDYSVDQVIGAKIVRAYGGKVAVSRLVKGHSTTATIRRLKD